MASGRFAPGGMGQGGSLRSNRGRVLAAVLAAVAVGTCLLPSGEAGADFILTGDEHLDVTTHHSEGALWNTSTADILKGGSIYAASVHDEAILRLPGPGAAHVTYLGAYDAARIIVSGGSVGRMALSDSSSVDITDGVVGATIHAGDSSAVRVSGGHTFIRARLSGNSRFEIADGEVVSVTAFEASNVRVSGGSVYELPTWVPTRRAAWTLSEAASPHCVCAISEDQGRSAS